MKTATPELTEERRAARQFIIDSWQKSLHGALLTDVEQQVVDIIRFHPEYHALLTSPDAIDYEGTDNPFLHLSMHLALHEQLSINQPEGIRERYQLLSQKLNDPHQAAHILIECLTQMLHTAIAQGKEPNPEDFMNAVDQLTP